MTTLLRRRVLVRLPIQAYRVGAGWMFGSRLLLLHHTGRRSGRTRHVVLEVIGGTPPDTAVVMSGFGERAQWYRNVKVDPRVLVSIGRLRDRPALVRVLSADEARSVLVEYRRHHPHTWSWIRVVLERSLGQTVTVDDAPPVVEFRLDGS
ncbi:nitroreductase family deazaflavin-dependent oxidoreductase [Actinomycetospora sp. NBRC 106378]|uniref:nitroreductase family deazaflavin-dependent oxidoreductase n=1 Tax=Actinomycetospora sp. NBRC 106378 TaxID=3032208 RepID=UPI0025574CBE|nr:nitroreductase family deazaflavin-dependent oxidoreductase [Actinomycetospora sp. NBRC 106378]